MTSKSSNQEYASRSARIDDAVRSVQGELWVSRRELWKGLLPTDLEVLEPCVALKIHGFSTQTLDLGLMTADGVKASVAGTLNRVDRIVQISSRLTEAEKLFTAAHELGHVLLHPDGEQFHRDRPFNPTVCRRDPIEREADSFAAKFLMPPNQVRDYFRQIFLSERFVLNDDTAYALGTKSRDAVMHRCRSLRDLSMMLARTVTFAGRHTRSLVELFRVTPTAMAIRLEELDLVAEPR
jgi:hypothetical protein